MHWMAPFRNDRFCDTLHSPAASGVQNPCPKSTSHNQRCHRVLQRSAGTASGKVNGGDEHESGGPDPFRAASAYR